MLPGTILARDHSRLRHIGMPQQRRLDLAGLDAEAAQLHLRIGAPEEVQHPVRAPARQVAGAVHPAAGRPERIGHEPLRRQPGAPEIAPRQPRSRDVELTRNPGRNRLQAPVQDVSAIVGQWATDRDAGLVWNLVQNEGRGIDAALGGTIGVGDRYFAEPLTQPMMKRR